MKIPVWFTWLMLLWFAGPVALGEQTWRLDPQDGWQDLADVPQGEHLKAIAEIRQQLAVGDVDAIVAALKSLKAEFPDVVGDDLDDFIAAEQVYAKTRLGRAARLYKAFLETWPDSALEPLAMERYFSIGAAFLQGQKRELLVIFRIPAFDDGVTIMRNIADRIGNAPIALRALQVTAENQQRRRQFIEAYHTWAEIASRWPTGAEGREALLRMAQALHAAYDGPDYDASVLRSAQVYFEDYIQRYPQSAEHLELEETLTLIAEQLAYKQYQTGLYYERLDNLSAARRYYDEILAQWPETRAAEKAAARLAPDAAPAIEPTFTRTLFNAVGGFLDSWFGVKLLFESSEDSPSETQ